MAKLSNVAFQNKDDLINKFFTVIVDGCEYDFKIKFIQRNEIFIQKKFYYEELTPVEASNSFEANIQNLILDSDDYIDNDDELRERSIVNKNKLLHKMFSLPIGDKKQGFRIIYITNKYIKIENVLKFDVIEKLYSKKIISLEYILHELILGNPVDYSLFKTKDLKKDANKKKRNPKKKSENRININKFDKLSSSELDSKISQIKGWQKLVFNAIDNYNKDVFTLETLEKESIFDPYRFEGESLIPTIKQNLSPLIDLGLVKEVDKNYVKLW